MKLLLAVIGFVVVCSGKSVPEELPPLDNSHYKEGETRYVWMTPENERVLIDLHEPVDEELFKTRNGANNRYVLFTRANPHWGQVLENGNINLVRQSNFVASRPTMVIVHGLNNDFNSPLNPNIRDAFLRVHNGNVIVVDWGVLANSGYGNAVSGVPSVGEHLGNFLGWLYRTATSGGNFANLHLVGFSLGAHVVGVAGRQIGHGVVGRVTGLDPAGPGWHNHAHRLSTNSGRYVECIHTEKIFFGIGMAIGHVDFFPNGGQNQPGCWAVDAICHHGRAHELFAPTIDRNHLVGRRCVNEAEANIGPCTGANLHMGNAVINKSGAGIYHVRTGGSWPF